MNSIEATLSHIRFQNEKGFVIGCFQSGGKEIVGLGNILRPEVGTNYKLFGKQIMDPKFGKQYKFSTYEAIVPKSNGGIYRYLVRTAKFVGPKVGTAIIERYGTEALEVLKKDPKRVATEIRGITTERAETIRDALIANEQTEAAIVEVEGIVGGLGLRGNLAVELVSKYGYNVIQRLKDDPYDVITPIRGLGFLAADKVALMRLKYTRGDDRRRMAGVRHILKQNRLDGNIWMREVNVVNDVSLGVAMDKKIIDMCVSRQMVSRDEGFVALSEDAAAEVYVGEKILDLKKGDK